MHPMNAPVSPPALPPAVEVLSPLGPVESGERVAAIDVLRGVALLGILLINIWGFGLPEVVFYDPRAWGGFTGVNYATWLVCHLFFDQKMMSLFSMLFGAGLVIMAGRAEARGASLAGVYYRRTFWLLVFGLCHAYLLWDGDILFSYALCAFALYPFRRLAPGKLIALGLAVFLLAPLLSAAVGLAARHLIAVTGEDGQGGTPQQREARELVDAILQPDLRKPEEVEKNIRLHRDGSYADLFGERAVSNLWLQTLGFALWAGPRAGGLMLLGMALMKLGFFTASLPLRFYLRLAVAGYAAGLPYIALGAYQAQAHDFDTLHEFLGGGTFNYLGSLLVALGHAGVVLAVCKAGRVPWLTSRLAAVGRMALSNYFLQTILCTTLFEGWGFGQFGKLDRFGLLGVVVSVWLLQLTISPLWLRWFRFGPAEWLWRSLTYGRLFPLRKAPAG
jgi:uncharacterized protein